MENYEILKITMNTADTIPNINLDRQKLSLATKVGGSKTMKNQLVI